MADASIQRFSVARYQKMIETGILGPDDKVELLENLVVLKMPRNPRHDGTIDMVGAAVRGPIPGGWILRVQQAITLPDSQPEPDFTVARGTVRSYLARHPGPDDIGLLIEVADSSLLPGPSEREKRDKARIYARAGIVAYWVVNLADGRIEAHDLPSGPTASPGYANAHNFNIGDTVPLLLDGVVVGSVPVADMLP
jgi:hypothetical protein